MPKWQAYLVTVGTEPGVYDEWPECAARVLKVEGSIYKGYRTKGEAWDAYRAALAEGRVRVVRCDTPPGPYGTVPPGARAPPSRNPSSAPSPAHHAPRQVPRTNAPDPSSSRTHAHEHTRPVPPSLSPAAHARMHPGTSTRTPPNAAPPNVLRPEHAHVPSPRRRTQSSAPSLAGESLRTPEVRNSPRSKAEPSPRSSHSARPKDEPPTSKFKPSRNPASGSTPPRASTSYARTERTDTDSTTSSPATGVTCIEPDIPSPSPTPSRTRPANRTPAEHAPSHRSASRAGSAADWSPLTNVTYIVPDEPDVDFSASRYAGSPSSKSRHRDVDADSASRASASRRSASRATTAASSPPPNVTHTVPDIASLSVSAHSTPRSSTRARTRTRMASNSRPASQASQSTRHRMREGVEYRDEAVQATPPPSPERTRGARSAGPSTPASTSRGSSNHHHRPSAPPSGLSSPVRGMPSSPSAATSVASSPARSTRTSASSIARSQSESAAEMRSHLHSLLSSHSSARSSPAPSHPSPLFSTPSASTARRSWARPRGTAGVRSPLGTPAQTDALLSPLGLGLSQPLHSPGVVYPAASDPRSPIQRSTSVPSSAPVFHRPSPPTASFSGMLFNP